MNFIKDKDGNTLYPITHALFFPAVMEDPIICGEFLEFVLGEYNLGLDFSNLSKDTIKSEETFVTVRTKSTRIDIFIDEKEYKANLEMQNQRKKGYFLPKRSKYHHMEMTRIQLDPSQNYDEVNYSDL